MARDPDDGAVDAGSREHYADAELYDYEYRRRRADVTFYRALAKRVLGGAPGEILELGCGSGRVTIPLARDGYTVTALDQSAAMLDRLRARATGKLAARIHPVEGDLCRFAIPARAVSGRRTAAATPPKRFPLVLAAFNVLEHLYTRGELAACLARVHAHLSDDGTFAFDVQNPDLAWLIRDPVKRWARTKFTDPSTGRAMLYSTNHDYDPIAQIALIRLFYEPVDGRGPIRVVRLSQRKWFPAELEALISHAGFTVTERFGDFFSSPLEGPSESQVLVCKITRNPTTNRTRSTRNSRFSSRI